MLQATAHLHDAVPTASREGFLPHGVCYLWDRSLVVTHVASDLAIGLSYVAISVALAYLVHRSRKDIPFSVLFLAFGLFIIACGMTHFVEVYTLWNPTYWFAGGVKVATAIASVATAAAMPIVVPRAIAMVREARSSDDRRIRLAAAIEANHAKSQFMATMSHELRTPLNAIVGYGELLRVGVLGPLTSEQQDKLDRMHRSAEHLTGLINEVLDFERIEAGRELIDVGPTDLHELLRDVIAAAEPLAMRKGLLLVPDPLGAVPVMRTDGAKVRQILSNLLSNAIKYTNHGAVTLTVEGEGDGVRFEVRDTGIGLSPDHLSLVFDPFWQADQRLTRRVGGSGLGLSIARRLAHLLGGEISVRSSLGQGSVFTVWIPASAPIVRDNPRPQAHVA